MHNMTGNMHLFKPDPVIIIFIKEGRDDENYCVNYYRGGRFCCLQLFHYGRDVVKP